MGNFRVGGESPPSETFFFMDFIINISLFFLFAFCMARAVDNGRIGWFLFYYLITITFGSLSMITAMEYI